MSSTAVFEFDADFQRKLLAFMARDEGFNAQISGLAKPEYFESEYARVIADMTNSYWESYRATPSVSVMVDMIRRKIAAKALNTDQAREVLGLVKEVYNEDLTDRDYILESVGTFARRQALTDAVLQSAELIDKGKLDAIEDVVKQAMMVGVSDDNAGYDFWERIVDRKQHRHDILAGKVKPDGITTGHKVLDDLLYHKGWGRKELTVLMGPAKSGKSMSLITFAMMAALQGYNVLYVSLEVATKIIADRLDANLSKIPLKELHDKLSIVESRTASASGKSGKLKLHDFPSGSLTPAQLRRLVHRYDAKGIQFDMVVVDYADLMAPDVTSNESRENSRLIYIGLRAIAQEFNVAMLSATQTNREGFKAAVGRMEHIAEDINKARTVDLLLSINATEDEKARNEARIYFAASRNQQGDYTVRVKTDFSRANYIAEIMGVE
jgi:replicative DNA helicase